MIGRNGWPFRIVIVEASAETRASFKHVLEAHMDMAVVGETASCHGSVGLTQLLGPDVVIIGPGADRDGAISSIEMILEQLPSISVITVRLLHTLEDRVAFVRAGVLTLLDVSECDQLPIAIRRADHIQQELRSVQK